LLLLLLYWFSLDYFVLVLFAFIVLGLVSSVLRQEIDWEERLGNDLFYDVTRMWANVQCDGRPAEYRWRPLFNAAKFG